MFQNLLSLAVFRGMTCVVRTSGEKTMNLTDFVRTVITTPSNIFAVGYDLYCIGIDGRERPLAVSSDLGRTWTAHGKAPSYVFLRSAVVRANGVYKVYLLGIPEEPDGRFSVYLSTDMKNWEFKSSIKSDMRYILALPDRLFVLKKNQVVSSTDDGSTWTTYCNPTFRVRYLFLYDRSLCCATSDFELKQYDGSKWADLFKPALSLAWEETCERIWDAFTYTLISPFREKTLYRSWGMEDWEKRTESEDFSLWSSNVTSIGCDFFAIDSYRQLYYYPRDIAPLREHALGVRKVCSLGDRLLPEIVESYIIPFLYPSNGYITELFGCNADFIERRDADLESLRLGLWQKRLSSLEAERDVINKFKKALDRKIEDYEIWKMRVDEGILEAAEVVKRPRIA